MLKIGSEGCFSRQDGKAFTSSILLHMPPVMLIENMLSYDYLSPFECIFLVGYYTDNSGITSHSIDIASQALMGGVISPRDPETNLKLKDLPKKRLTGEPVFPDLSWLLSFDEAEQWAVNNFDLSFKALKDIFKCPSKEPLNQQTQNQPDDMGLTEKQVNTNTEISESEQTKLLRIIGLLTEAFVDANKNSKHLRSDVGKIIIGNGSMGKTGKSNLLSELYQACNKLEIDMAGLQKDTLGKATEVSQKF